MDNDKQIDKPNDPDRDSLGRFRPGNSVAKGMRNPGVAKANALRAAALSEITPNKVRLMMNAMVKKALKGNVAAAELVLRYSIGPSVNYDLLERLRAIERAAGLDGGDQHVMRLETPLLEFEFTDGGEVVTVKKKPTPISDRDIVDEGSGDE